MFVLNMLGLFHRAQEIDAAGGPYPKQMPSDVPDAGVAATGIC